ncbi:hypothetical protein BESB_029000 [Besnoitia besnoiti]|uniref:Uncharacterized protein n=1 Tax=Besnoitia besnoiti TaxID=94643 RepID=A0A2A9M0G4_BESBE|nr:uncharacterized protein BESB_029000 [Besnoitia besnoiti]PFH31465.1 hypothetical protein BESB_029000 [Besnoitia besnoiti]
MPDVGASPGADALRRRHPCASLNQSLIRVEVSDESVSLVSSSVLSPVLSPRSAAPETPRSVLAHAESTQIRPLFAAPFWARSGNSQGSGGATPTYAGKKTPQQMVRRHSPRSSRTVHHKPRRPQTSSTKGLDAGGSLSALSPVKRAVFCKRRQFNDDNRRCESEEVPVLFLVLKLDTACLAGRESKQAHLGVAQQGYGDRLLARKDDERPGEDTYSGRHTKDPGSAAANPGEPPSLPLAALPASVHLLSQAAAASRAPEAREATLKTTRQRSRRSMSSGRHSRRRRGGSQAEACEAQRQATGKGFEECPILVSVFGLRPADMASWPRLSSTPPSPSSGGRGVLPPSFSLSPVAWSALAICESSPRSDCASPPSGSRVLAASAVSPAARAQQARACLGESRAVCAARELVQTDLRRVEHKRKADLTARRGRVESSVRAASTELLDISKAWALKKGDTPSGSTRQCDTARNRSEETQELFKSVALGDS